MEKGLPLTPLLMPDKLPESTPRGGFGRIMLRRSFRETERHSGGQLPPPFLSARFLPGPRLPTS